MIYVTHFAFDGINSIATAFLQKIIQRISILCLKTV